MKYYIIIICITLSVFSFSQCSSKISGNNSINRQLSVEHRIEYKNKGTRSEERTGSLIINGTRLPEYFNVVTVNNKVYIFKTINTMWGDKGYWLNEELSRKKKQLFG